MGRNIDIFGLCIVACFFSCASMSNHSDELPCFTDLVNSLSDEKVKKDIFEEKEGYPKDYSKNYFGPSWTFPKEPGCDFSEQNYEQRLPCNAAGKYGLRQKTKGCEYGLPYSRSLPNDYNEYNQQYESSDTFREYGEFLVRTYGPKYNQNSQYKAQFGRARAGQANFYHQPIQENQEDPPIPLFLPRPEANSNIGQAVVETPAQANDQLRCPFEGCERNIRPFTRASDLTKHLNNLGWCPIKNKKRLEEESAYDAMTKVIAPELSIEIAQSLKVKIKGNDSLEKVIIFPCEFR